MIFYIFKLESIAKLDISNRFFCLIKIFFKYQLKICGIVPFEPIKSPNVSNLYFLKK